MATAAALGSLMEREIAEQPAVYRRILTEGIDAIGECADQIRSRSIRLVVLAARGSSDNAALYGKYLVETILNLPCGLASPSTVTLYRAAPAMENVLVIALSQSGESPDIARYTGQARERGAVTVAVTNSADSALGRAAELHLPLLAGEERAVAATKTYTAEQLVMYLLVNALAGRAPDGVDALPDLAALTLACERDVAQAAERLAFAEHMVLTSRGFNLSTAQEGALKLIETARLPSHAYSAADLMHGPLIMVDAGFPVIAVVPQGPVGEAMQPTLDALRRRGADPLVVTNDPTLGSASRAIVSPLSSEALSPLLMIIPLQLLALHSARLRGFDPDAPPGLTKVTRTT